MDTIHLHYTENSPASSISSMLQSRSLLFQLPMDLVEIWQGEISSPFTLSPKNSLYSSYICPIRACLLQCRATNCQGSCQAKPQTLQMSFFLNTMHCLPSRNSRSCRGGWCTAFTCFLRPFSAFFFTMFTTLFFQMAKHRRKTKIQGSKGEARAVKVNITS